MIDTRKLIDQRELMDEERKQLTRINDEIEVEE
jgi:hypothetical protein